MTTFPQAAASRIFCPPLGTRLPPQYTTVARLVDPEQLADDIHENDAFPAPPRAVVDLRKPDDVRETGLPDLFPLRIRPSRHGEAPGIN
jgi:hypothetical protein